MNHAQEYNNREVANNYINEIAKPENNRFSANVQIQGFGICEDIKEILIERYPDTNISFEFHIGDIGVDEPGICPSKFFTKIFDASYPSIWSLAGNNLSIKGYYNRKQYTAIFSPI